MSDEQRERNSESRSVDSSRGEVGERERYGTQRRGQRGSGSGMMQRPREPGSYLYGPGYPSAMMGGPWEVMRRMSEDLDRLFDSFHTGRQRGLESGGGMWAPELEVERRGNELCIRADLPGLKPEDVEVNLDDGLLTIQGERQQEKREDRAGMLRSERSYGRFVRSIQIPDGIDESDISATFRHGVLEITIPVPERQQRKIQIKT